jgi:Spy/CpxP family protein refolding chaperone
MNRSLKAIGMTVALAVMIPLSAYAATAESSSVRQEDSAAWSVNAEAVVADHGGHKHHRGMVSQEVLDLLKLDKKTFSEKIKAGSTLAQIAEQQGVSRDSLKKVLTESFNKRWEERKKDFLGNLDKIIDSKPQAFDHSRK